MGTSALGTPSVATETYTTVKASQQIVGIAAVQLACSATPLSGRRTVRIKAAVVATATDSVYLGTDNTVSSTTGFQLKDREYVDVPAGALMSLWAIGSSIGQTLLILEVG